MKTFFLLMSGVIAGATQKFELTSPDFQDGKSLAKVHSLKGGNKAPELVWKGVPGGTKSFALIVDDPDAPRKEPWVHWLVYNIPPTQTELSKSLGRTRSLSEGINQGINDFNKIGYDGPYPPAGPVHHYHFVLYALDTPVKLAGGAKKNELLAAMKGHIKGTALLIGTFKRDS